MKSLLTRLKRKKVSPEPNTTPRRKGSIDFLSSPPLVGNVTLLLVGYEHSGVHSFLRTLNHIGDSEDYLKLYKEKLPEYSSIIQSKTIAHIQLLLNTLNEKSISLFNAVNQELFSKVENINFMNDKEWKQYPKLGQWIQNIASDNYVLSLFDSGHFDDIILYEMKYCFNNAQRILVPNYVPEFDDTIFVEVEKPSGGITEATITHDQFTMKFIGVNLSLMGGSARKWLHQFQNVDAVVHVLSIGNYDKHNEDGEYKLLETHEDCDILGQNCYFKHLNQVVFFTKVDQMKDKLTRQKIPFSCYPNFTPSERDSVETIMDFLRHTFTTRAKESGVNISSVYFCSDLSSTDAALNFYRNDLTCRTLV